MTWKKVSAIMVPVVALSFSSPGGTRAGSLVANGSFEQITNLSGNSLSAGSTGQLGYNIQATGWTNTSTSGNLGYNFLYASGTADTTGATGDAGLVKLWGPGGGPSNSAYSDNGLPASSPDGGNFVAMDGAYHASAITQSISGLTQGTVYEVGFWWGGAQQSGFTGPTTEQFEVSLGSSHQYTQILSNASHGFTGWMYQTFDFTADTTGSETLSFFAIGNPVSPSVPPFVLLDGVTMSAVPEPSSVLLFGIGVLGLGAAGLRQRKYNRRKSAPIAQA